MKSRHAFLAAATAAAFSAPGVQSAAAAPEPELVNRASGAMGAKGNAPAFAPSVSADGRFVAFASAATNLDPGDQDAITDIFVRDTGTNITSLVSRASGASGVKGDDESTQPSISADGRYVAFSSRADTLVPGVGAPGPQSQHIFVRDLVDGTTAVVDRASGADGAVASGFSSEPSLSADSTRIAFVTFSSNLDPAATDLSSVYVRDTSTLSTSLVSRVGVDGPAGSESSSPSISSDGNRIAFFSRSAVLAPDQKIKRNFGAVFVRDLATSETTLVSRENGPDGRVQKRSVELGSISADGKSVVFATTGENLNGKDKGGLWDVYTRRLDANRTVYVSRSVPHFRKKAPDGAGTASISGDGTRVAFAVDYLVKGVNSFQIGAIVDSGYRRTRLLPEVRSDVVLSSRISANGRWLAFESWNKKDRVDVYLDRLPRQR